MHMAALPFPPSLHTWREPRFRNHPVPARDRFCPQRGVLPKLFENRGITKIKKKLGAIDRSVFEQILDRRTAKSVWDSLKRKYGGNDRVKKSMLNFLRREFEVLEMKDAETITEYFAR
ncbi:retrovirus-related Pol polyprotein from transposon TNT 1-94, partial [Trifolium pratense]